jgi:hypothetical protein
VGRCAGAWLEPLLTRYRGLRPDDLLEYSPQSISLGGIDALHERNAALQMFTEARMTLAVLARGSKANAVSERRL